MRRTCVLAGIATLLLTLCSAATAGVISIDFEDGTGHDVQLPSNHYPGVTISNGVWIQTVFSFAIVGDGNFALGVDNGVSTTNEWAFPGTTNPIVLTFDELLSDFSIQAFDVGFNGALIEARDDSNNIIGTDSAVGSGVGTGFNPVLSITAPGIRSVHLRQQFFFSNGDGLGFDNLTATTETQVVPEPHSLLMFAIGLVLIAAWVRFKRSQPSFAIIDKTV